MRGLPGPGWRNWRPSLRAQLPRVPVTTPPAPAQCLWAGCLSCRAGTQTRPPGSLPVALGQPLGVCDCARSVPEPPILSALHVAAALEWSGEGTGLPASQSPFALLGGRRPPLALHPHACASAEQPGAAGCSALGRWPRAASPVPGGWIFLLCPSAQQCITSVPAPHEARKAGCPWVVCWGRRACRKRHTTHPAVLMRAECHGGSRLR